MTRNTRVLLVAATSREAAAIGQGTLTCGAGERAGTAVDELLRGRGADLVLVVGVCGGLDPSLVPGDLVVAHRVVAPSGAELLPQRRLVDGARQALRASGLGFVSSSLLTLERPAATRTEKTRLWNTHGAAGVDMETYGIARAAEAHGVPWLALRAILDPAHASLPPSLHTWGGEDAGAVVRQAVRRPLEWPSYLRLALQMRRALRALRAAVPVAVSGAEAAPGPSGSAVRVDAPPIAPARR